MVGDNEAELLARVGLSRLIEPGDRIVNQVINHIGAQELFTWLKTGSSKTPPGFEHDPRWEKITDNWRARLPTLNPHRDLATMANLNGKVLIPGHPGWPEKLNDLGDQSPLCLWVRGSIEPLQYPSVAFVGSRDSTGYGRRVTIEMTHGVAEQGFIIISGGAFGIDATAHRAMLDRGDPTVVFTAGGVDRFYPQSHTQLFRNAIAEGGAVVSEVPPGSAPMRHRFLMRNRLIAALGLGVIVVEAAWRSGALNTARHAWELLRPVGAVPGPITSMASAGCHRLIREGQAVMVTDAKEIVELIGPIKDHPENTTSQPGLLDGLDPQAARVLEALPLKATTTLDRIVHVSGMATQAVMEGLGILQLAGKVHQVEGQWKRLT